MANWMDNEIRKDPDEEFDLRDRRVMEINKLLNRLLEDENIEHDAFMECIDDVTATICKALKRRTK